MSLIENSVEAAGVDLRTRFESLVRAQAQETPLEVDEQLKKLPNGRYYRDDMEDAFFWFCQGAAGACGSVGF